MTQPMLPDLGPTIASPLCWLVPTCADARCYVGPAVPHEGCENQALTCVSCGRSGLLSTCLTGREAAQ